MNPETVSSYLTYLPEVLWSAENDPGQLLGRLLLVFEHILTGVESDATPASKRNGAHPPLEHTIATLSDLFDPWRTPQAFLAGLAGWVDLELGDWSEYQQRSLISRMVSIYRQNGLKEGLYTALDLYVQSAARPRIVIDDGDALLRGVFTDAGTVKLHNVASSRIVHRRTGGNEEGEAKDIPFLLHPSAVAIGLDNKHYFVADRGGTYSKYPPAIWKIDMAGRAEWRDWEVPEDGKWPEPGENTAPSTISIRSPAPVHMGRPLYQPTAVAVDSNGRVSVLNIGKDSKPSEQRAAIFRFDSADSAMQTIVENTGTPGTFCDPTDRDNLCAVAPVDMVLDETDGYRYYVLDRGNPLRGFPLQARSDPRILIVAVNNDDPLDVSVRGLKLSKAAMSTGGSRNILEPTALVVNSKGQLIIADANPADPESNDKPADLILVDLNTGEVRSLLGMLEDRNPLVFPTGLVLENDENVLVCDTGLALSQRQDDRRVRTFARSPTIYRVDLQDGNSPSIMPISDGRALVNPTKMKQDSLGRPLITDAGESLRSGSGVAAREWRLGAGEFGVAMHFSNGWARRLVSDPADKRELKREIRRVALGVEEIIAKHKPGQAFASLEL